MNFLSKENTEKTSNDKRKRQHQDSSHSGKKLAIIRQTSLTIGITLGSLYKGETG